MERHRLTNLARKLIDPTSSSEIPSIPCLHKKKKVRSKTRRKGKAYSEVESTIEGVEYSPQMAPAKLSREISLEKIPESPTLEDRLHAIENKLPAIENELKKNKVQNSDIEQRLLVFQNDLEVTKLAYSELIFHELSKSNVELKMRSMGREVEHEPEHKEESISSTRATTVELEEHQKQPIKTRSVHKRVKGQGDFQNKNNI